MAVKSQSSDISESVLIPAGTVKLRGDLAVPDKATGLVVFAHGSGSSRLSPRNRAVARSLNESGLATLLIDLLDTQEEEMDHPTRRLRLDVQLLAERMVQIIDWLVLNEETKGMKIGLFGASTGAAAAIVAAGRRDKFVSAVVSRGGRPDLAADSLKELQAPTLLIVGGADVDVLELNTKAQAQIQCANKLAVVAGATHLFPEKEALEEVTTLARDWFAKHLK
ncbi:MAG TPA: alpha/beta family hydrolase [Planktothrix sp.]